MVHGNKVDPAGGCHHPIFMGDIFIGTKGFLCDGAQWEPKKRTQEECPKWAISENEKKKKRNKTECRGIRLAAALRGTAWPGTHCTRRSRWSRIGPRRRTSTARRSPHDGKWVSVSQPLPECLPVGSGGQADVRMVTAMVRSTPV